MFSLDYLLLNTIFQFSSFNNFKTSSRDSFLMFKSIIITAKLVTSQLIDKFLIFDEITVSIPTKVDIIFSFLIIAFSIMLV